MAGRKQVSYAVAVAVAVALVAMLVVATAAEDNCGIRDKGAVMSACLSYCAYGSKEHQCCDPLRQADVACLCRNYWSALQKSRYASCANKIESKCGIRC
ncbi:uncharacterized protein LOC133890782 [Phragmites australis]|uniref:uncharacterized protein LOC133890782 n=1 Tax=Phragmites australis TaxID=29695 RepID=UPI002D781AAC|nr:uncharacterized protein LOC133890782 [Phragmites australis]